MRKLVPILFLVLVLILSMALMACSDNDLVASAASLPSNSDNILISPLVLSFSGDVASGSISPAFNTLPQQYYLYEFKFIIQHDTTPEDDVFVGYSYFTISGTSKIIENMKVYYLQLDNTVSIINYTIDNITYSGNNRLSVLIDDYNMPNDFISLVSVVNVSNSQIGNVVTPPNSDPIVPTTFYNYQLQTTKLYLPWALRDGDSFSSSSVSESFNSSVLKDVPQDMLFKSYTLTVSSIGIYSSSQDINITGGAFVDAPVTPLSEDISPLAYIPPDINYNFLTYAKPTYRGDLFSGDYNWLGTGVRPVESEYSNYFVYLLEVDLGKPINIFISMDSPLVDTDEFNPFFTYTIRDNYVGLTYDSFNYNPNFPTYNLPFTVVSSSVTDEPLFGFNFGSYSEGYSDGYDKGYIEGSDVSSSRAYDRGFYNGKLAGIVEAAETHPYTFMSLMSSVVDAPLKVFRGIFNLDILGINLAGFFLGLLSVAIIITIVRLVI